MLYWLIVVNVVLFGFCNGVFVVFVIGVMMVLVG